MVMIDVFRFQIATYIALTAVFTSLVLVKEYSRYLVTGFVGSTFAFLVEMGIWLCYYSNIRHSDGYKETIFLYQNLILAGTMIALAILAAFIIIVSPDNP
jgi:dolichol kinase